MFLTEGRCRCWGWHQSLGAPALPRGSSSYSIRGTLFIEKGNIVFVFMFILSILGFQQNIFICFKWSKTLIFSQKVCLNIPVFMLCETLYFGACHFKPPLGKAESAPIGSLEKDDARCNFGRRYSDGWYILMASHIWMAGLITCYLIPAEPQKMTWMSYLTVLWIGRRSR